MADSKAMALLAAMPNAPSMTPAASATGAMARARLPMRCPSVATPPSTLRMARRTRSRGPEIMSTRDNVANTLKTSILLLPRGTSAPVAVNHAGQRGEISLFHPRSLTYLCPPFGNVLRRGTVQPVKNQRVPLPEGIRGRR